MPHLWRGLRLMPWKPSSNIGLGRTLRTGPNFSSVVWPFVMLDNDEAAFMRSLIELHMKNWNGIEVGQLMHSVARRQTPPVDRQPTGS
jgi:hypothetical protein